MTHAELINVMAERTGYQVKVVREFLETLRTVMTENLAAEGDYVALHQFGIFKVKQRAARKVKSPFLGRTGRGEPKTGIVPEHMVVKFRPSRHVRRLLNP